MQNVKGCYNENVSLTPDSIQLNQVKIMGRYYE